MTALWGSLKETEAHLPCGVTVAFASGALYLIFAVTWIGRVGPSPITQLTRDAQRSAR